MKHTIHSLFSIISATVNAASGSAAIHHDTLRTAGAVSGPGLFTHLDSLRTAAAVSGPGLFNHLDSLRTAAAVSGPGLTTHVDALASTTAIVGSGVVAATGPSGGFLDKVFQMLIQLSPSDVAASGGQLNKSGNDVVFAAGSGNMAMTFIKK